MSPVRIHSILHPTDFSAGSEVAFLHALRLAVAARARLAILHADRREPSAYWDDFPAVRGTLERWGMLPPGSRQEDVFDRLGVAVKKIASRDPDPVEAIARYADAHAVDLIVLATSGREGLPRWLGTVVAEPVLRRTQTATLFIPPAAAGFVAGADGGLGLRRILVPVDVEPSPSHALRTVRALLDQIGTSAERVRLLHVGGEREAPAILHEVADLPSCESVVRDGDVVDVVLGEAAESDLVVMATRGVEGIVDAMRGSTTQRVLRRAPCPVLAVPED